MSKMNGKLKNFVLGTINLRVDAAINGKLLGEILKLF